MDKTCVGSLSCARCLRRGAGDPAAAGRGAYAPPHSPLALISVSLAGGHRGFDILHVASALTMKATQFLTFDANQRELAEKEGLVVPL